MVAPMVCTYRPVRALRVTGPAVVLAQSTTAGLYLVAVVLSGTCAVDVQGAPGAYAMPVSEDDARRYAARLAGVGVPW